jgi:hypothetical protein
MKRILLSMTMAFCISVAPAQNPGVKPDPSLSEYIYMAPQGWTTMQYANGISLRSNTSENCMIDLYPMRPSSGDLFKDVGAAWGQVFQGFEVRPTMTFPAAPALIQGISAQGWAYVMVKQGIGLRGSARDPLNEQQFFGFIMAAKLGNRVAVVSGVSKDPLVSACFGRTLGDVWPRFFSTLQFRSWTPPAENRFAQNIQGIWQSISTSIGGGAAHRYVFTPAGRYAELGVMQRYMRLSRTETAIWTSKTFGDGAYSISGNQISFRPDRGKPETGFLRLEQISEDGGKTWKEKLYILTIRTPLQNCGPFPCANAEGDVAYERQRE